MRFFSPLAVAAIALIPAVASASSLNLSTGTATYYVQDPAAMTSPASVIIPNPGWHAVIPGAMWIGLGADGSTSQPGGLYLYTGPGITGYYNLKGSFASDNNGSAVLLDTTTMTMVTLASNVYGTSAANYSFNTVTPFSATLNPNDTYVLRFDINNGNGADDTTGPTGLLAGAVASTPEPSSLALLGTGVLSVAGMARRKFRRC